MATRHGIAMLACGLLLAGCGSSNSSSTSTSTPTSTAAAQTSTSTAQTSTTSGGSQAQLGFEGMPIQTGPQIGDPGTTGTAPVDGIKCAPSEQLVYHIHAHLTAFDNGTALSLPGGIGIPGSKVVQTTEGPVATGGKCIYWLHTHAPDGVIHIESPTRRIYTLGNFFGIWRQPLSRTQVGDAKGAVSVYVNGKPWTKNPRAIPLVPHASIQISIGQPIVPFQQVSWGGTGL
jgi:hypothetical protein